MHPPQFSTTQNLSDWPECRLEIRCPCSERVVDYPVKLLIERHGDRTFDAFLLALRCTACGKRSAAVHLVAGQTRTFNYGPPASWAVELVAPSSTR